MFYRVLKTLLVIVNENFHFNNDINNCRNNHQHQHNKHQYTVLL